MDKYYLNWMIDSCINKELVLVVKPEMIQITKNTQILKKLLSNSQVIKYLCLKDMEISQEQISILQSLLECIDAG